MIMAGSDPWLLHIKQEEIKSALRALLDCRDGDVRRSATDLVHQIGAMGHYQYGDLLAG